MPRLAADPNEAPDIRRSVSIATAIAALDVSYWTLYRMLRDGTLEGHKMRGRLSIYVDSIYAYQAGHPCGKGSKPATPRKPRRGVGFREALAAAKDMSLV